MKLKRLFATALGLTLLSGAALAADAKMSVKAKDQSVSGGTVTAAEVMAGENGWLVVHRTDAGMKPGPVIGHSPLKKGKNAEVVSILTEKVASGDMLMLMLHSEDGGKQMGIFEYSLGAKEDGPVRVDGKLVMATIKAK